MRIPRLYLPQPLNSGATLALPPDRQRYLCRVLRLQHGAPLILFNGEGGQFQAALALGNGTVASVDIGAQQHIDTESPLAITLLQGISRGERMDFTLRKATELGVSTVVPLFTTRCEVRLKGERLAKRITHWQGIIISACEQCGRNRVPVLRPAQTLTAALDETQPGNALLLDPNGAHKLADMPPPDGPVSLLIGPEGGLSDDEIGLAQRHGFKGLRLGPRILRTETAPLAALAAMQALWGDL